MKAMEQSIIGFLLSEFNLPFVRSDKIAQFPDFNLIENN